MNDEHQPASGPVVAIEAVAIRVSYGDAEQPPRTQDPQGGFVEFEPVSSAGMKSYPEALPGIVPQSMVPEQRELAAGEKWEIRPPDDQERLSTLLPRERDRLRVGAIIGVLLGAFSLTWWVGFANTSRIVEPDSPGSKVQQPVTARTGGAAIEDDPISHSGHHDGSSPEAGSIDAGIERKMESHVESLSASDNAPPPTSHASTTNAVLPNRSRETQDPNRLTPPPETRPTTIAGWTIRKIVGGKAVLQGPYGVRSASIGETIPELGRIDSIVRWGNHWIVATSKGLVSD